ncbi:type IV pilin protein [Litorilituus sediminis]|uniref:Type IV pilin protein n=2 Tax=Litorilituus sediminis TaxID=718192 RepID=A0A4P6PD71_9GAMM|nr:type IV pilin protein [Litorilituus sediminis]
MFMVRKVTKSITGFTLVEVMIVVAIISILATIAYPSYVDHVIRSNRAEALIELTRVANLQEQFFVDNNRYTDDLNELGLGGVAYETQSANYSIASVIANNATQFTLTATAQHRQTQDTGCTAITLTHTGQKDPLQASCWER